MILQSLLWFILVITTSSKVISYTPDKGLSVFNHWKRIDYNKLLHISSSLPDDLSIFLKPYPSIRLKTPTNVTIPSMNDIFAKLEYAKKIHCFLNDDAYSNCAMGCNGFEMLKIYWDKEMGHISGIGVNSSSQEIIVTHRGTFTLSSWLKNISYKARSMENLPSDIQIHGGFYDIYLDVKDDMNDFLIKLLKEDKYKGYKVIFTGISLGAAIATVHIVDQAKKVRETGHDIELYAFNSPRVGNREFVDYFVSLKIPVVRYTNKRDPIPHLPPRIWNFTHIPGEIYTPFTEAKRGVKICSQEYDEDPECSLSAGPAFNPINHFWAFNKWLMPKC